MFCLAEDFIVLTSLHKGGFDWGYSHYHLGRREIMLYNLVELKETTSDFNPKIPNITKQIPLCLVLIYLL